MPEQKDKQQLMSLFGTLMQAKDVPEQGENAQSSYYDARKEYERERLKTAILAPVIGGIFSDLISAPFREPLENFKNTEEGAKVYSEYASRRTWYNDLMNRQEQIRKTNQTPEDFHLNLAIQGRKEALAERFGDDWENDPVVFNSHLYNFLPEARAEAAEETVQYYRGLNAYKDGFPTPQEFQATVQRFNPEPSSLGQKVSRWFGRVFSGESKEEQIQRMINQITGGPDSPFGIDHEELSKLVNDAIYIDSSGLETFKNTARQHWMDTKGVDEISRHLIEESRQNEINSNIALFDYYSSNIASLSNSDRVYFDAMKDVLNEHNGNTAYFSSININAEVARRYTLPNLNSEDIEQIQREFHSGELFELTAKLQEDIEQTHPMFKDEGMFSPQEQASFLEKNMPLLHRSMITRATSLAQYALMSSDDLKQALDNTPDAFKSEFMRELIIQQLPIVFETQLEHVDQVSQEGRGWFGLFGSVDVTNSLATGRLSPVIDIAALETNVISTGDTEPDPPSPKESSIMAKVESAIARGDELSAGDSLISLIRIGAKDNLLQGADEAQVFTDMTLDAIKAGEVLGGNPLLVPGHNPDGYTIRKFPFPFIPEEIELEDGSIVEFSPNVVGTTRNQYNIKHYGWVDDTDAPQSMYGTVPQKREYWAEGKMATPQVPFESLRGIEYVTDEEGNNIGIRSGYARLNAMWASKVYHNNEKELVALGVPLERIQEGNYGEWQGAWGKLFEDVKPELREKAEKLHRANRNILEQFDFSGWPLLTNKAAANDFLRDAYRAYEGLDLEEWTEDQIDEAGNIMSPPSLLEPDTDIDTSSLSSEAAEVANMLSAVGRQITGDDVRPEVIAALMGNIEIETGNTFDYQQEQNMPVGSLIPPENIGYGLFQVTAKRPTYIYWLDENNKEDSVESQIEFVYESIYKGIHAVNYLGDLMYQGNDLTQPLDLVGEGNRERLQNIFESGNTRQIARAFSDIWEKPDPDRAWIQRRQDAADNFYALFNP